MTSTAKTRLSGTALAASALAFYSGFAIMAYEIILGRAITPYFGGSVYTWGAVISVFLTGMSIGFILGGVLADRFAAGRWAGVMVGAGGALLIATPLALEPVSIAILETGLEPRYGAALACFVFGFVPPAFFAMLSPYAVKIGLDRLSRTGSVAGRLSGLNAIGSILGSLATTFIFIPTFGGRAIIVGIGASALVVAISLIGFSPRLHAARAAMALTLVFGLASIGWPSAEASEAGTIRAAHRIGRLIERSESLYNHIFVVERSRGRVYMTFGYGGGHYVESAYDPANPDELVIDYTRIMPIGLVYGPSEGRAAFVGLGGGRTATYLAATLPGLSIEVAELDPEVIRLASTYFGWEESDRLSVTAQDGRIHLYRAHDDEFDYIYLDAYRGPFVPFHLTTREFYELCQRRLTDGGVLVQNVEPSTLLLDSAFATIDAVFDNVDAFDAGGNVVLVAYDGERLSDEELAARAAAFDAAHSPRYPMSAIVDTRSTFELDDSARVLTDDFAPVEALHSIELHNRRWED